MPKIIPIYRQLFILLLAFVFTNKSSYCQWYDPEKVNKKAKRIYEEAYDLAENNQYRDAIAKIGKAIKIEPDYVEAFLSMGSIYAELKKYDSSVMYYEKAFTLDPKFSFNYHLPYSISLAGMGEFEKAALAIDSFIQTPGLNEQSKQAASYRKSTFDFAINYKKQNKDNYYFNPVNVGSGINSDYSEYFPCLTIDRKKMIFTRRVSRNEDFYVSDWINGKWSEAKAVEGDINTADNEGAQTISQDGDCIIFTGCNYQQGFGSCDLYISYRLKNGNWTEAFNLGNKVNTEAWEAQPSLSPDKRDLYFCSNRKGGYGGYDIWVSHVQADGTWGRPENLGPIINTSGNEYSPFIHSDNQTFYFNSNKHQGYGKLDIFMSKKTNEENWTTPFNLGYPINSIDDEGTLYVASDGKTAYYSSSRNSNDNKLDIYQIELNRNVTATRTLWIQGKVTDKKTNAGLPSSVELTEINTGRTISLLQTDEDGHYLAVLPEGKDYIFNVNRKGYLFYSDHFSIPVNSIDSFYTLNIPLQPIEAGASVVLKNIFFDNNKFSLQPSSLIELDNLVKLLNDNPKLILQISGHTDNVGKKNANLLLSINRAKSVVNYLTSKGIKKERLVPKGFGDEKPVASNDTEHGKSLNRRTEINVISN
ncbi:MAG: flagellar motor protein MotB [Ferruginibacter sp.]|nr:flagellar motor protein MotB [Ferruginibacter sp.]